MKFKHVMVLILAFCLLLSGCSYIEDFLGLSSSEPEPLGDGQDGFSVIYNTETPEPVVQLEEGGFVRAIWVSYLDIRGLLGSSAEEYSANLDIVIANLQQLKVTDVYFQVRAFGDSFGNSGVYPSAFDLSFSGYYKPEQDMFSLTVEKLKTAGYRVHAWVNPYRLWEVGQQAEITELLLAEDAHCMVEVEGRWYFNPASALARATVLNGVQELLDTYDISGIHFDDYFYPTTEEWFDQNSYDSYVADGGDMSLGDWRRHQVEILISDVYSLVKTTDEKILFGISPDASIDRNYAQHYFNVEKMCAEQGYFDYICPQVYFGYENETMPFSVVAQNWKRISGVKDCIIGLACYKIGVEDTYAGSGIEEWVNKDSLLAQQYGEIMQGGYGGVAFYRYDSLFNPAEEVAVHASVEIDNLKIKIQE